MSDEKCLFCRIVSGEIPATVVYVDPNAIAFLDHRPLFLGHTLLVPRDHVETLVELPSRLVGPLFTAAQSLAQAVPHALGGEGSFVAMNNRVSQSVPHLHIHIVPRRKKDGLKGFFWPRTRYKDEEEMNAVGKKIAASLQELSR